MFQRYIVSRGKLSRLQLYFQHSILIWRRQQQQSETSRFAFAFHSALRTAVIANLVAQLAEIRHKRGFPPQNRRFFPVLSPFQSLLSAPPLPPQQKSEPVSSFAFVFGSLTDFCLLLST
jgi:hypothetical protein